MSGELAGDDEVAELRWFHCAEIGELELDPLNWHLLRDVGVLSGLTG